MFNALLQWLFGGTATRVILLPYYVTYLAIHYAHAVIAKIFTWTIVQYLCYYVLTAFFIVLLGLFTIGSDLYTGSFFRTAKLKSNG